MASKASQEPLVGMAAEWSISTAEEALEIDGKCFTAAWEGAIAAKHIGAPRALLIR